MDASSSKFTTSDLLKFDNAVAGHDGVLTNETGELIIKPCTQAEVDFYQESTAYHPDFAAVIPTFLGTLQLGRSEQLDRTLEAAKASSPGQAIVLPTDDSKQARDLFENTQANANRRGKAIDTELGIVLENLTSGYSRPNVLDVKLGQRLWDDSAPESKRERLDKVAKSTTSSSLGFRVAGMKVWNGKDYTTYDKLYGRGLNEKTVHEAFLTFFDAQDDEEMFAEILPGALEAVEHIEGLIRSQESIIYASSLLFTFEGDRQARREAATIMKMSQGLYESDAAANRGQGDEDDDDDDESDSEPNVKLFDVRLIDFAHSTWTKGTGPDENMLRGIRSTIEILKQLNK